MKNGPYAIGYVRVSKETESGLGLAAQRASLETAASRLGLPLHQVFTDEGVCGALAIAARPGLMEAVTGLRHGDVLIVAKRDRLGRDVIEVALIERLILKRGARVVSAAGEGTENEEPSNWLLRRVVDAFAEYERLIIIARTKAALNEKRARGEQVGTLPFGVQLAADRMHLEPAPAEQRILERLRALKAAGYTLRQIADDLNRHGWTTRHGGPWRFQYVARALRSRTA